MTAQARKQLRREVDRAVRSRTARSPQVPGEPTLAELRTEPGAWMRVPARRRPQILPVPYDDDGR